MSAPLWLQFTGNQTKRKRAELACVACHSKKIRCDLQARGTQGHSNCTKCEAGGKECRVRPSKRGRSSGTNVAPLSPPSTESNSSAQTNRRHSSLANNTILNRPPPSSEQQHSSSTVIGNDNRLLDFPRDLLQRPSISPRHVEQTGNQNFGSNGWPLQDDPSPVK
ncbi:hypothetical protein N7475_006736 [Penicillium sp. IBT 31633x]|nr:hypothetical protein N7475_006736 [Penicillium sp. IBT 31633x]